jgi:hypothetical protein
MTKRESDRQLALDMVRALLPNHTVTDIAFKLTAAGIPTLSGRPGAAWHSGRVSDLARELRGKKKVA